MVATDFATLGLAAERPIGVSIALVKIIADSVLSLLLAKPHYLKKILKGNVCR